MKENQTNNSESTNSKGISYKHDSNKLKRRGIHEQEKEKESNFYPSFEDEENTSSDNEGSSLNSSFGDSPELRYRGDGKGINSNKADQVFSKVNKNQTDMKQNYLILGIIITVIICIVIFLLCLYPRAEADINIENLIIGLKGKYNTQSDLTYRSVKYAINSAQSEKSSTPGILILLASEEAKNVSKELASDIANAVSKPCVDIKSGLKRSPGELKRYIEETIHGNLSDSKLKAVLVEDLDHLPFEAAMIFHSYCDHENAPFKKALYVMTMSSEEKIPRSSDSKMLDTLASNRLNSVWKTSGEDQVSSLISRLTGTVVGVTP